MNMKNMIDKNLVETYVSHSPGSQAQVDAARKAFKAELKNGPTKTVNYANGYSGQKAFGNFDLQLFHQAYDAELDADGLLVYFDDNGLLNDRKIYPALKQFSSEGAKFAKELWVLQYGQSDYKLVNVPATAKPLASDELLLKLLAEDLLQQIFKYSVQDIVFTTGSYSTCEDVFADWFGSPNKLEQFLSITYLKDRPYQVIKQNICSVFLCLIAAEVLLQQAKAQNRGFANTSNELLTMEKLVVEYNTSYKVPVRLEIYFKEHNNISLKIWAGIRFSFRFNLGENDKLLDMPVYVSYDSGMGYVPDKLLSGRMHDILEINKFSDITFAKIEEITNQYIS